MLKNPFLDRDAVDKDAVAAIQIADYELVSLFLDHAVSARQQGVTDSQPVGWLTTDGNLFFGHRKSVTLQRSENSHDCGIHILKLFYRICHSRVAPLGFDPSSILYPPSSILYPPSSTLHPPSSILVLSLRQQVAFASVPPLRENGLMGDLQLCPSCGEALPEDSIDCPRCLAETIDKPFTGGPSIAAFKIVRVLGKGGMGTVYLAEDSALNRLVAIKVMSKILAQYSRGRDRFLREARAMATVEHPHLVHFHSFGEFSGQPYIVMEYVEGETLAERIKRQGPLPVDESMRILRETIEALDAAWEKQIVHRDVKPSNILLDPKGRVRVADFGLAKPLRIEGDSTLTNTGDIIGSPHYISPEKAQGQKADFRSDIYSLGIVLYEMLVGERPFEDTTPLAIVVKHLNAPMPSPREKRPELPESVVRLLQWMTRKEPDKRPSSYAQLLEQIDSLISKKQLGKSAIEKFRVAGLAAIFVLVIGIAIWSGQHRRDDPALTRSLPRPSPVLPQTTSMAVVSINALPWARIKLTALTKGISVPVIPEKQRITPCNLSLPEGKYSIELLNDTVVQPVQQTIKVQVGKVNSFSFTMPAYDPKKAFAQIRGGQ